MSIHPTGPEAMRPEPLPQPEQIVNDILLSSPEVFGNPRQPSALVQMGREAASVDSTWPGSIWAVSGTINDLHHGVEDVTMLRLDTFREKRDMPRTDSDDLISAERLAFLPGRGVSFERRLAGIPDVKRLGANPRAVATALRSARTLTAEQRLLCAKELSEHYLYRVPVRWEVPAVTAMMEQHKAQQQRGSRLGRMFGRVRSK